MGCTRRDPMNDIREDIERERKHVVATLRSVGPDAPTLAGEWLAADIARHLAAQDRLRGLGSWAARRLVLATGLRLTAACLPTSRTRKRTRHLRRTIYPADHALDVPVGGARANAEPR